MNYLSKITLAIALLLFSQLNAHDKWQAVEYSREAAHAPTPLPDRVVLTWEGDPSITQSVTWRTDVSIKKGIAQLAIANSNGRALETETFEANTSYFKSDINEAHYHTATFTKLTPDTLYTYRVETALTGLSTIISRLRATRSTFQLHLLWRRTKRSADSLVKGLSRSLSRCS